MKVFNALNGTKVSLFWKRALVFCMLVILMDFAIGKMLKYLYFQQKSGSLHQITYILDSVQSELVVIGSSSAAHGLEPATFEQKTGLSFYNAGYDGTSILHHEVFLQGVLKTHTPKAVILVVDFQEFKYLELSYERLFLLLPYYKSHPFVRQTVRLKSPLEKLKLLSSIYPFNSTLFTVLIRNKIFQGYNAKRKEDIQGYLPLNRHYNGTIEHIENDTMYSLDSNKIRLFINFLTECRERNIPLYLVLSPRFVDFMNEDISVTMMEDYARKHNIRLINFFQKDDFLLHPEYFADRSHLNTEGAKVFSNMVIDSLMTDPSFRSILPQKYR